VTLLSINVGNVTNYDGCNKFPYHERHVELVVVLCGKIFSQLNVTKVNQSCARSALSQRTRKVYVNS